MKIVSFESGIYVMPDAKERTLVTDAIAGPFETRDGAGWWLVDWAEQRMTPEQRQRWQIVNKAQADVWQLLYAAGQLVDHDASEDSLRLWLGLGRPVKVTPPTREHAPDFRERAAGDAD